MRFLVLVFILAFTSLANCENPDLVTNMPDYAYKGQLFSGYLTVVKEKRYLHYVFIPSQNDPTKDPLVIWFNGGPGCSSLIGFIQEHGPVIIEDEGTTTEVNKYSWNTKANMLYIESPVGVGFSYSENGAEDLASNDFMSADDNFAALQSWFKKYPEYSQHDLYISGESYAGIYVPFLANKVVEYNQTSRTKINLKGILVGNGVSDWNVDVQSALIDYAYNFSLYGKTTRTKIERFCKKGEASAECKAAQKEIKSSLEGLNIYDFFRKCPKSAKGSGIQAGNVFHNERDSNFLNAVKSIKFHKLKESLKGISHFKNLNHALTGELSSELRNSLEGIDFDIWPSSCDSNPIVQTYLNRADVKAALHVKADLKWTECNGAVGNVYTPNPDGSHLIYPKLLANNIRVLIYTGDTDGAVPFNGTFKWIENLRLNVKNKFQPWKINKQVVGRFTEYEGGLTLKTIKGTGHMSVQWKRLEGFTMFNDFISSK